MKKTTRTIEIKFERTAYVSITRHGSVTRITPDKDLLPESKTWRDGHDRRSMECKPAGDLVDIAMVTDQEE